MGETVLRSQSGIGSSEEAKAAIDPSDWTWPIAVHESSLPENLKANAGSTFAVRQGNDIWYPKTTPACIPSRMCLVEPRFAST